MVIRKRNVVAIGEESAMVIIRMFIVVMLVVPLVVMFAMPVGVGTRVVVAHIALRRLVTDAFAILLVMELVIQLLHVFCRLDLVKSTAARPQDPGWRLQPLNSLELSRIFPMRDDSN